MLDSLFIIIHERLLQISSRIFPEWLLPWVSMGIIIGSIVAVAPLIMMYLTWLERKLLARIQNRLGPNRVGIYGLGQPIADGLKMLIKEDIVPKAADGLLHWLAPVVAVAPAILLFAVIPFGNGMIAADLNIGLLYVLAVSSISTYAIFMGGWASRNKFSMLGAMRSVAQIVSYEVPAAVSLVCVIMISQTMSLGEIVDAQSRLWFVFTPWGLLGCAIFFLSSVAEVNRTPFDMPEAESELVAGFHTEYSGMKFALWYMAEFLEAFAISAFTVTFFLGGWHGPAIPFWIFLFLSCIPVFFANVLHPILKGILILALLLAAFVFWKDPAPSWFWFFFKTYLLIAVLVWLRGTFPRLRVDQLMGFAWKFLLPLALMNILAAGIWAVFPGFKGTVSSLILIIISFWFLVRVNSPSPLKPRTYVLAD